VDTKGGVTAGGVAAGGVAALALPAEPEPPQADALTIAASASSRTAALTGEYMVSPPSIYLF
jgi:hypothetical protein